nr:hypothetical protein [uncultured Anaerobutyricum sp.]
MNRYIIVEPGGDITKLMLSDLEKCADISILKTTHNIKSTLLKKIWSHHIGYTLNKRVIMPFQRIWWKFYTLSGVEFNKEDQYYIIFGNAVLNDYDDGFLRYLTQEANIHLILYFSDPVDSDFAKLAKVRAQRNKFEYIFTFDPKDAEKYGYIKTHFLYSTSNIAPNKDEKSNLCFVGENKGRLETVESIYEKCLHNDISCNFRITRVPENHNCKKGIIYNSRISYLETISQAKATDCLLEILQKGQSGVTFRYYEAVCYNKKLLTNNVGVYNLPYYDSQYMQVFEDINDIDFEWIKKDIKIDYKYKGDFSPVNFIEQIKQLIEENK